MIATLATALILGHLLGDFMIQQHGWSARKAERTLQGQAHMAAHVLTYTAACWVAVYAAIHIEELAVGHGALAVGMAVNSATHWVLDLRSPLEWVVRATGHGGWLDNDRRALFIYDQVLHVIILIFIAYGIAAAS
jgi:hypothetical protein